MLNVELDGNYKITSDSMNYILQERKIVLEGDSKGKEYFTNIGYYNSLNSLLKSYSELSIRNSDAKTIKEILKIVKETKTKIDKLFGED